MKLTILALLAVLTGAAVHKEKQGRALLHSLAAKPIGEGAYQSHEAVKERTTDKNTHCEESKWGPCYKHDYIDKRGSPPTPQPPAPPRSGAAQMSVVTGLAAAVVAVFG